MLPVLVLSIVASYGVTSAWRRHARGRPATSGADSAHKSLFPSGRYLVAYALLAGDCGFCTEKGTRRAIRALRASLRTSQGASFARVAVVGVAIDEDVVAGIRYLKSLGGRGEVFDQLSVGGSWLNDPVTALVWRTGMATPEVPQIVLLMRAVDAGGYPRHIDVQRDSMLLRVAGRDDIIAWVDQGTPLAFHPSRRATPSPVRR
jgi:hypothetical protein